MKTRFTTIDLRAAVAEIGGRLLGLRVANVYDINNKTYLIKLAGHDVKEVLLLESGFRVHMTSFDWPKNNMPSNFSMKLRKHIRGRRLENIRQLGMDRAVDLQFGSGDAAYHLIVELYDRGNIALTDHEFTILTVLRARSDNDDVRFVARERYPIDKVRQTEGAPEEAKIREILKDATAGQSIKKLLNPNFVFGPALIEHCLVSAGYPTNCTTGKDFDLDKDIHRIVEAMAEAQKYLQASGETANKGYIIQRKDKKPAALKDQTTDSEELLTYSEFHPFLFKQFEDGPYLEFPSFTECLDEFFSKQEGQKLDMKALQQEKDALKKLENVKKDQERRITSLQKSQTWDQVKGELIEMNLPLVDEAIRVVRSAIANQIDWKEIEEIIKDAQKQGDVVAKAVKSLKLETNHITMMLQNPYHQYDSDCSGEEEDEVMGQQPMKIAIDLGLSAYANARKYFDLKKHSKKKEQKTVDAADKAIKSAEKKTKQALKDVAIVTSINKTRKTYWFEKFFWFISSENYLVIAGRDKQQNEIIYKRYLKSGDIYVHADLHGASSLVIKNPSGAPVPPKTLNEAGTMAVCFSVAWEAKVITSAWWVHSDQVSKTAPTGEYLTTGSFMIRGKKNYLPPVQLMMGFGFLFKLEDTCVWRHKGERKVWVGGEDDVSSYTVSSVGDLEEEINLEESETKAEDGPESPPEQGEGDSTKNEEPADVTEEARMNTADEEIDGEREEEGKAEQPPSSSGDEGDFPDTAIDLHHVTGVRSSSTSNKGTSTIGKDDNVIIHLGDDKPVKINDKTDNPGKKRLTAKQRREQRKKKKQTWADDGEDDENLDVEETKAKDEDIEEERRPGNDQVQEDVRTAQEEDKQSNAAQEPDATSGQPVPLKRGQKHKLKKMKQKYRDQDEEERKLKMELLASSRAPKEKTKKGKKAAKQKNNKPESNKDTEERQPKHQQLTVKKKETQITAEDERKGDEVDVIGEKVAEMEIKEEVPEEVPDGVAPIEVKHTWKTKGDEVEDDEDIEDSQFSQENSSIIDSLTGCPHEEDLLLFAIPVCAPYSAMQNYKFKVKVTPGTGKKGKAAKAALNMFQLSKECTPREKDLFKGCKDVDMSRNMPGKVKISAPNLQKAKKAAKGK